jgi:hypothetical protein
MSEHDLILVKAWCWQHLKMTWHVRRVDGIFACLECRLEGVEVPPVPEGKVLTIK